MKKIDPFKLSWDEDDWNIYINNLELLCVKNNILKREFSKRAGVVNAFRTDPQRPSPDTIDKISKEFGVETDWLFSYHDIFTPEVNQPDPAYDKHGGYKPDPEKSLGVERGTQQWKAFELLSKIYASKDQQLIEATFRNLKTFSDLVERMSKKHDGD